ncbi:MAG: hypothetical protein OER04_04620 [Cyclobacteriaceae bacterium]|nr:hypothetical protein [Cyclobacteriaceae bacterium]
MILKIQSFLHNLGAVFTTLIRLVILAKFKVRPASPNHKEAILLGNGPSLKKMLEKHGEFLEGKDLICVNHFPSTELYQKLKPKYYVTSAPDLWLDEIDKFFVDQSNGLFNDMVERTKWPLVFYIPHESSKFKRWQNILKNNPNIDINYYNNTPVEGWRWFRHACFKANLGMPRPHNVMIPSLMLTLNMGYEKIYLWGADHSWLSEISVNDNNEVLINQKHFYDEHQTEGKPLDKRGVGKRNLPELLTKFVHAFNGYFVLKEYAESLNTVIVNNTPGSFIDAFTRQSLSKLHEYE